MSFYQYRKILFGFILGLMILIVFGFGAQQISAQGCKALGDVCSSASECCSNFNCNGKCCVSSGFSCAFSLDCCSGICASNNTCQDCLGDNVSCNSSSDCCSGQCTGGICQSSVLTNCMFCAGNCLTQNQSKICADGSKIELPFSTGGCGSCTTLAPGVATTIQRCCLDDPTNCLYTCHKESAVSCGACGTIMVGGVEVPLKCIKDESTSGACSGGGPSCLPDSAVCGESSECCNNNCSSGICGGPPGGGCPGVGQACDVGNPCCSGLLCRTGTCRLPSCEMRNINCPANCAVGRYFDVSYEYRDRYPGGYPYFNRMISSFESGSYNNLGCNSQPVADNAWHSETKSVLCRSDWVSGILVGGKPSINDECGVPSIMSNIECSQYCSVTALPVPAGHWHLRVKTASGGVELLRLIPIADAIAAGNGVIKVQTTEGDFAADLTEISNAYASPIRVKTNKAGDNGVRAWRKAWYTWMPWMH